MSIPAKSNPQWLVEESDLPTALDKEALNTIFATGNGLFCCRGTTPFCAAGTSGSLIGGLYSDAPPTLTWIPSADHPGRDTKNYPDDGDILNNERIIAMPIAPNPWKAEVRCNGESPRVSSLRRALDMKQGILFCDANIEAGGETWRFESCRFVSLEQREVAVERISITPVDTTSHPAVVLTLDNTISNSGSIHLWENEQLTTDPDSDITTWRGETMRTGQRAAIAMLCADNAALPREPAPPSAPFPLILDRFVGVTSTTFHDDPAQAAESACREAAESGFEVLLREHTAKWKSIWKRADIIIDGPLDDQRAVRYAIFQLASSLPRHDLYSIGAKFLSGEGYRGMVFWDTDVFILPYLTRVFPENAKDHIAFRFRTLDKAVERAGTEGFDGARYPWQATPEGADGTAPWLLLRKTQLHVTADVVWGVLEHLRWSGDIEFMTSHGNSILQQCARYWADKVSRGDGNITDACGPDENHPQSDNNAYTNALVRNLLTSASAICDGASPDEKRIWREMADRIPSPKTNDQGVIEQYDGFFELPVAEINAESYASDKYQTIKQADVLMIPFLFPHMLTKSELAANYDYYEPKTTHESSLSRGVHAIAAAQLKRTDEAYSLFRKTAFTDLGDLHGNTMAGLHAAGCALTLRVIMEGFAGLDLRDGAPRWTPNLPDAWQSVKFKFLHHGELHEVDVRQQTSSGNEKGNG